MSRTTIKRIESRLEIQTFLDRIKYAIQCGSTKITFQKDRIVDQERDKKFTNRYTIGRLFSDEDEIVVLRRELFHLTVEEYIETVKDTRFPKLSEMRVFGKQYFDEEVYIKVRVELISLSHSIGENYIFVMSFHY